MIVSIPKDLLLLPFWKGDKLFVYALSRSCIGVSPKEIVEWKVNALHWESVKSLTSPKTIKFKIPDILYRFYNMIQPETRLIKTASGDGTIVLITIDTETNPIYNAKAQITKVKK